ncbi:MAG: hypothetical protein RLZZ628_3721 [Bacteroidota bacterium]|jgi:selenide,water dikinase
MLLETNLSEYQLTAYSHGAGCGCKIAPNVLDIILKNRTESPFYKNLLVGNSDKDDAAVMDLGDGTGIVSTTDFFMPIVDDAFDFGQIASVNAISDIYAMGGTPLMAIAILGWPVSKLPAELAGQVLEGSRKACADAGIPLAGGHSIDTLEPIFGLAVTGRVPIKNIKRNGGTTEGAVLFLTKPLGVGILTTAQKKGKLKPNHAHIAPDSMKQLNDIGALFGTLDYIEAMTDVTGFGLAGHLLEMCDASMLSASIEFNKIPVFDKLIISHYLADKCIPGGTLRNHAAYGHKMSEVTDFQRNILCDPQTSGGLLVAVRANKVSEFQNLLFERNLPSEPIGHFTHRRDDVISVY